MEKVEETVLRHLATEVFCSIADVEALIRGAGAASEEEANSVAVRMLTDWEDRGWVDTAEMDPAGLLTLTEKAFAELTWLPRPASGENQ